ncbi:MAG: AAA family ATPase [Clostridiales bacterium]|jgi:predicted ATPase|nr:AAA family ATPase [Clostridiales bacterium]
MMISKLSVKNFKALDDFEIEFTPFTALIGANACGKSTVLQALDFVRSFATRDLNEFMRERRWMFGDLKSQFWSIRDEPISFNVVHSFPGQDDTSCDFSVNYIEGEYVFIERIENAATGKLYAMNDNKTTKSSFFKNIDVFANLGKQKIDPVLYLIKSFYEYSTNYELLSPAVMRTSGNRGYAENIGANGRQLAAFISRLNSEQRKKLDKFVSGYLNYPVEIRTRVMGTMGNVPLTRLSFTEKHSTGKVTVKPGHMSDGLLRIIALGAISVLHDEEGENKPDGLILIDEIENGINLYSLEDLIKVFKTIIDKANRQVIITTHNPLVVNYLDPKEIMFMWRDENGRVHAKPMFSTDGMKDTLDAFNPGEVWMNYNKDEILDLLNPKHKEDLK